MLAGAPGPFDGASYGALPRGPSAASRHLSEGVLSAAAHCIVTIYRDSCAISRWPCYTDIMSRTPDTSESPKTVTLVYKEEGDTRTRCGPVFTRMSDGCLRNY